MAVVDSAEVLIDERSDRVWPEVSTVERRAREHEVAQERTEVLPKPPPDGDAESLLPTGQVLGRKRVGECLSKDPFAARASDHQGGRKLQRVLEEAAVQKGRTNLERIRHRGDVDLHEEVVREVELIVE